MKAQGSNNTMTAVKEVQNDSKDYVKDYFVICWQKGIVGKGKLSRVLQVCLMKFIEANNTYINTYVLSPTTLDDSFYLR